MSINFALPVNTDLASGVLAQLRENLSSILTQTMGSGSNIPTGSVRLNPTTGMLEYYNGSTWSKVFFGTTGGSANAQTLTLPAFISAYQDGQVFNAVAGFANTSTCTLNVNGLGAIGIRNGNSGTDIANGEIISGGVYTFIYYNSKFYLMNPSPGTITWSPTIVGFSANPTGAVYEYSLSGKYCDVFVRQSGDGTSNSASFSISLPFTAATLTNMAWIGTGFAKDNGAWLASPAFFITSGSSNLTINRDAAGTGFTNSGAKRADCHIRYRIA